MGILPAKFFAVYTKLHLDGDPNVFVEWLLSKREAEVEVTQRQKFSHLWVHRREDKQGWITLEPCKSASQVCDLTQRVLLIVVFFLSAVTSSN